MSDSSGHAERAADSPKTDARRAHAPARTEPHDDRATADHTATHTPGPNTAATPLFHVVLHEPEIPNNTGNIGRTCVACGGALHLIQPLGFDTSAKACRRAGLDYWPRLAPSIHPSWEGYLADARPGRLWLFSTHARRPVWDAAFEAGDHLVFGKETRGLPRQLVERHADRALVLPMVPDERSLNLATAVCAVVYEFLRQLHTKGRVSLDAQARIILPGLPPQTTPKPTLPDADRVPGA